METPRGKATLIPHYEQRNGILDHEFIDAGEGVWHVTARVVPVGPSESVYTMTLPKPLGAARNGAISGGIRRSQGASFGRAHWRGSVRTLHKLLYCCCRSRRSWVMIADTAPADDAPADGLHCKGCMDARCPHCRHEHTQPRQRPGVRCDRNPCQTLSVIHSSLSC